MSSSKAWRWRAMAGVAMSLGVMLAAPLAAFADEPKKTEPAKAEPAKTEPAKTEPAKAEPAKPAAAAETLPLVKVELVNAGAEPRAVLKYAPKKGDQYGVVLRREYTADMKVGMDGQKVAVPGVYTRMLVTVGDVAADKFEYSWDLSTVSVQEGVPADPVGGDTAQQMVMAMSAAKGQRVTVPVGLDGRVGRLSAKAPAELPPDAKPLIDGVTDLTNSLGVVFPAEAIGAGGQWRVTTKLKADGMIMTHTTTYTLASNKDGVVVADYEFTQSADKQDLDSGDPQSQIRLLSHSASGRGKAEIALARPTIMTLNETRTGETKITVTTVDQDTQIVQKIDAKDSIMTTTPDKLEAAGRGEPTAVPSK